MNFEIKNILDILERGGEDALLEIIAYFSCSVNEDDRKYIQFMGFL